MPKRELTIGKYRGLQQISDDLGIFRMVALDHQETLREGLNPADPDHVPYERVVDAKMDIVRILAPESSAFLLDVRYAAGQSIASGALPGRTGLVITLELSPGFGAGETTALHTSVVPGWDVAKVRRMGASAVKLLVYYHPESTAAGHQEDLVRQIAAGCNQYDIPLVLECLTHPIVPGMRKDSPEFAATRPWAVIESARRLCPLGVDLYKAEFPADVQFEHDEAQMLQWCRELTEAAEVPWVVLSAAVTHEAFCRQVDLACSGGAGGFLGGRSIWKEAVPLPPAARRAFLAGDGARRLRELTDIARSKARPWTEYFQATAGEDWYRQY